MSSEKENRGYRTAFKETSLFGGVQVITIFINVIRFKLLAIWLGPGGFGIISIFNSLIQVISSISNIGLASSAVRDIAKNNQPESVEKVLSIIKAIDRWVVVTGLVGCLFTIILSKVLSKIAFNTEYYTHSFVFLSCIILFSAIYNNNYAILQGLQHLFLMAKSRIYGALISTIITLPIYFFLKEQGIVISLILTSLITCIISIYFRSKVNIKDIKQPYKESFFLGLSTVKLGFMMAISAFAVSLVESIIKSFITNVSGMEEVGLYQAGWTLNASYLGLIFTAMATDYFPRISKIANDNSILEKKVNEQAEIGLLILGIMIAGMMIFLPLIIPFLYSGNFVKIIPMTIWLLFGSLIKVGSWSISYIFLAKGDGKKFLFNELGIKCITLPSYLLFYYYFGLVGIGYGFCLNYTIYFIWVLIASKLSYNTVLYRDFWCLFIFYLLFTGGYILSSNLYNINVGGKIIYLSTILFYSFYKLNKKIGILTFLKTYKKR